jgi:transposase-like protein
VLSPKRRWFLPNRRQWRCWACERTFSVTSGTRFAHQQLPLHLYPGVTAIYTKALKDCRRRIRRGGVTENVTCQCPRSAHVG